MTDPAFSKISEQLNQLRHISVNEMASFQIKSADYDHIPQFDGKPHNLLKFVTVVRQVKAIVCSENNSYKDINEKRLLSKVLARLTNEADYINTTCEFSTINELLEYLEKTFRDSRSIEQLTFELFNTTIRNREHPLDFLQRLDRNRTLIISRHRIDKTTNRETVIAHLETNLLYHFFTNMPLHIRTYLMTKTGQLKNLDDLRNLIQNENHLLFDDLISSGSMNRAGDRVHHNDHNNKYNKPKTKYNNYRKPQNTRHYYQPPPFEYRKPHYNHPQHHYYNSPQQSQHQLTEPPKIREITYPQNEPTNINNNNVPNYNKEWHPRDQHQFFNRSGKFQQQRPYNGRTGQTVSMRTAYSRPNNQPIYEIEQQETEETQIESQTVDPRDKRIKELEEQLKNSFLEKRETQIYPT